MSEFESVWSKGASFKEYPKLTEDIETDIALIGGGLAGLAAAYFLSGGEEKIIILEADRIGSHTSGNTTAKITSMHELKYDFLIEKFGKEKARIYADANQWAIDEIQRITELENIDCQFRRTPAHMFATTDDGLKKIKKEFEAAESLGIPASFLDKDDFLPFEIKGEMRFENQAIFHPNEFMQSIAKILENRGCQIFEKTRITDLKTGDKEIRLKSNDLEIKAKKVIIATNYPIYDKNFLFMKMHQVRSYAIASKVGVSDFGIYMGIDNPNLTIRPLENADGKWAIIGGQDHVTGEMSEDFDPVKELEKVANQYLEIGDTVYRWSAQDSSPMDKVPYIGEMDGEKNIFVTTGFGEWGMTTSIVSAKILSDLINGKVNPWSDFFSPSRLKPVSSELLKQFSEVAKGYLPYLKKEKADVSDLPVGSGIVIDREGTKVAVSKDGSGGVHEVSAKCTHMGCIVKWNHLEESWDCPCHGSRFDVDGNILNSPANKNLKNLSSHGK